ncbi:MAG TPA: RNA polymerase sigma-70 factor [Chryseosolibacter sp.]|nr:RNA polymerase sigma-70 factor [Chryseosolibacter sp.]
MKLLNSSALMSCSDEQLVAFVRDGNDNAFAELFHRHWDNVYKMIYSRIRDRSKTEGIAQEIFMKFWDKRSELVIDNFSAYLYTCVKHRCINYIESKITRKKHWDHYKVFLPQQDDATDKAIAFNDLREALEKWLNHIPNKSKMIFRLNRLEGQSVKEIAGQMNLSEKAIQYHLTRSVKELRLYLKEFLSLAVLFLYM